MLQSDQYLGSTNNDVPNPMQFWSVKSEVPKSSYACCGVKKENSIPLQSHFKSFFAKQVDWSKVTGRENFCETNKKA